MSSLTKHSIAAAFAVAFAVILYFDTASLSFAGYLLPRMLSGIIVLLSLAMVAEAWRCRCKTAETAEAGLTEKVNIKRVLIFVALIISYIVGINVVGYFIITPLYIIGTYYYLQSMSVRNSIFIAAGFTVFVYLLFVAFLQLPIPLGPME